MKKILKATGLFLAAVLILFVVLVTGKQYKKYEAPYPGIHASDDKAVVRRGKYLVTALCHCADCHGSSSNGPFTDDLFSLSGGRSFKLPIGTIQAPNITQDKETGIGNLTDGELARSLRYGVGHDGRSLIPFMNFQNLTDADLTAVISYLRTIPPEKKAVTIRKFNLLGYVANAFLLKPVGPAKTPDSAIDPDTTAVYGKYLATYVAGCRDCHTNRDLKSGAFTGPEYAGGFHMASEMDPEHFECISPNLTTDSSSGRLTGWTPQMFVSRFHSGKLSSHSPMPWNAYRKMDKADMVAIFNYLRTLPPEHNIILNTINKIK